MQYHSSKLCWLVMCLSSTVAVTSTGADKAAVTQAIAKGSSYLKANLNQLGEGGNSTLAALALLKANVPHDAPELQQAANLIVAQVSNGKYTPVGNHIYEAGVAISFLVDLDAEKYKLEIQAIRDYLIAVQRENGSWDYPSGRNTNGDTSVTQYACLGLWSASRAGAAVPVEVWQKATAWLIAAQSSDGGYRYVPGTDEGWFRGEENLNMTVAGIGALLIAARELFPANADSLYTGGEVEVVEKTDVAAADSVLQRIDLSKVPMPEAEVPQAKSVKVSLDQVKGTIRKGRNWLENRFRPVNDTPHFPYYYFYSVERLGALANVSKIGSTDWFDGCSTALIGLQKSDGSWQAPNGTVPLPAAIDTAFAVLFLSRSTGKILNRTVREESHGGGLLTGGKGEPTEAVVAKKEPTPLDQLLKSLQDPGALDLEQAQSELIEQVQLGDRTELIGQKEMLVKLIQHPHGEIRRTAAWALGRTNDLHLARYLVAALEDSDLGVMMEAHAALCWLSRRFDGFGLPVNPLDDLKADASEVEKTTAIEGWRVRARRNWGNWYLQVRPYADRGDEFEAKLRQRLGEK